MNTRSTLKSPQAGLDCLMVHVPKFQTYYPAFNVYQSCNRMAMGLLALADLADRQGYAARVINLGVEKILDKSFSFIDYLKINQPKVIGFSLHFHHSLVDTLDCIEEVRKVLPDAFIFAGGFTATFFAEDLLKTTTSLDAVIKGDAETPLLELLATTAGGDGPSDLSTVPNLAWRHNGEIRFNPQSYCTTEEYLNELNFARFDLLEHWQTYVGIPTAYVTTNLPTRFDQWMNKKMSKSRSTTYWGLPIGRGCVSHCFYCGGGAKAQQLLNKRGKPIFRKPEKVIETIKALKSIGYEGAYVSFDPHPWSSPYYVELFQKMRREKVSFNILFSSWGLPSREFLEEFAKTVGPESAYMISPETGSDELRAALRTPSYTNEAFKDFLQYADKLGVRTVSYFTIGMPGETMTEFKETVALKEDMKNNFPLARSEAFLIEIEPAAPWYMQPEDYDIHLNRRSFADFVRDQSTATYSSMTSLGYTSSFFGPDPIGEKEFSAKLDKLRRTYFDNSTKLGLLSAFWKAGQLFGVVPRPKNGPRASLPIDD